MLPGREARALSAVCRSVSPSCHWVWGSSHSFSPATCCSARRMSESARQRSTEVRSLSTSAKQETNSQPLHSKPVSFFGLFFLRLLRNIHTHSGNVTGNKMQIGSTNMNRLSECQKLYIIAIFIWTEDKSIFSLGSYFRRLRTQKLIYYFILLDLGVQKGKRQNHFIHFITNIKCIITQCLFALLAKSLLLFFLVPQHLPLTLGAGLKLLSLCSQESSRSWANTISCSLWLSSSSKS